MSDNCPDIWNVLHDAIVVGVSAPAPGDVALELACDYLRDRFPDPGNRFVLTLHSCDRLEYRPWTDEENAITDFSEIERRRLWVLSADPVDGHCKVLCSEAILKGIGGTLTVSSSAAFLRLDTGRDVSLAEIMQVATEYWDEWEAAGKAALARENQEQEGKD